MSSSIQEYGAPLGWTPKSLITWNGHFLPYALRWDDMRFDLGRGEAPSRTVIELDILSGATREWSTFLEADKFYGLKLDTIRDKMQKNYLLEGRKFFYPKKTPPNAERLRQLKELAEITCSFSINHVGSE